VGKETQISRQNRKRSGSLDLHLLEAVLPDDDVGRGAVLAVVEEDDPVCLGQYVLLTLCKDRCAGGGRNSHCVGVHRLARVEFPVLEVGQDLLLDELLRARLEGLDL
jgi:hypothetical protein